MFYKFEDVLSKFYQAMNAGETPKEQISVKMARLAEIVMGEQNFARDKKHFNPDN